MKRLILAIVFLIVCVASIIYGGKLGDFIEIETTASVMCLSCMGLQQ